jgi:serine/threonine protein kinase
VPDPLWPLGIPTRLRPVKVLGQGASSVVWQVRDTAAGIDLAVKVVSAAPGSVIDPARRAETEARALARLDGLDGVVALHEVGRTEDGAAWLAHDLAAGGSLAARDPWPSDDLASLGATLARTLAAAHGRQVHHGDISPANVLFDDSGRPLLADFGMAGLGHAPDDPGGLTPAFAAPERLRGAPPSAVSDVYSLAATLAAVADGPPDAAVTAVLDRCRAEDPSRRPSAATMSDELGAAGSR